jgi:hypothetical protein
MQINSSNIQTKKTEDSGIGTFTPPIGRSLGTLPVTLEIHDYD